MAEAGDEAKKDDPLVGRVVNGRYTVLSVIARGGMGKVYRAEQAPLGRLVALKVLQPNYQGDGDPEFHRRFFLEAATSAKLTHPNTVTVFDYGRTEDDIYYIAMELLEGRTLQKAIREEAPIRPPRAIAIAQQISRSLREAHGLGVVHRDLKPANVYLVKHGDENDFVKVLDFGLVKDVEKEGEDLTQTGLFMGSPKYMSPEQIRGEKVDARTDVYALAVILYEMLTGRPPFERASSVNILMAHVHDAAPAMGHTLSGATFAPELEAVVMKGMAKAVADRFASMDEFSLALRALPPKALEVVYPVSSGNASLETVSVTMSASMTGSTSQSLLKRQQKTAASRLVLGLVFAAAAVGGGLAYVGRAHRDDPEPATEAAVTPVPEPVPQPVVVAPPTPTAAPEAVHVTLESTPPGAAVLIAGVDVGTTPLELDWRGEDAREGRQVTFTFHLAGHRDYTVMRTVRPGTIAITATLEEDPTRRVRTPRPGPTGTGNRPGFQINPY